MKITSLNTQDTAPADLAVSESLARYLSFIAHLDMPLSAKIEMVSAMRQIMASFVDSAHGDDPIQHVHEMHARDEKRIPPVVSSGNTPPDTKAGLSSAFASPASGKRRKERP
ncbi:hypothetical protein PSQ90_04285 [Devosia rhodophyticola]|uniref:DUF2274 domain-containing protein n=1 Tax=Devosia rhodophyticola TaxID=3026423 RepID=A0ABY7YZU4_9HYPH|nr:hypothetical protein [Devosia rhodophyticola]WDR06687.1 hypothetical protein PSQ90_04285 [Devosia rhodophyticola]